MKLITGNTYPVKDKLKTMGGKWDADQKGWLVPDEREVEALALVKAAPKSSFSGAKSNYRPGRCRDCGCAASRYNPIYRSGQCKNCWLSDKEERDMGY